MGFLPVTNSLLPLADWVDFEYMRPWQAGILLAALSLPIVFLGLRSLTGMGRVRKWVAIIARLAVLLVLVALLAGLQVSRKNHDLQVMVLSDVSPSVVSGQLYRDFPGKTEEDSVIDYVSKASDGVHKAEEDQIGLITFTDSALINAMPNKTLAIGARALREPGGTTDIAGAINLGLASLQKGYMHRLLLISDGNQTAGGNLEEAIAAASSQKVPIDVMPLKYAVHNEVMVEKVVSGKAWRREDEPFTLDVFLKSTNLTEVKGTLRVEGDGGTKYAERRIKLEPASGRSDGKVEPRLHVEHIAIPELKVQGVHNFTAVFTADNVPGKEPVDRLTQNNSGGTFVMVNGTGKVLYVDNTDNEQGGKFLESALISGGFRVDHVNLDGLPADLIQMQNYDAIILANVPRVGDDQDRLLARYVHEMGGGLLMIGGPQSYGAGGWQGSQLEKVLPVNMDIPAQRQMPKGALVLIMHSCEMPDGNSWGEKCALKAIEALSSRDEIGVISYGWNHGGAGGGIGGAQWDFKLQEKKSGADVMEHVKKMQLGDMPSFDDCLQLALNGTPNSGENCLVKSNAARKHVIIISDGDCSPPTPQTFTQFQAAKVTVSTVPVYPHNGDAQGIPPTMKEIAEKTKGKAYPSLNSDPSRLPQIFIKEAMTVRRTLLQTDDKGYDVAKAAPNEQVQGIESYSKLMGYVLTSKKNAPQIEMPLSIVTKDSEGKSQVDPLLASWQTGLGRAVAFTSDATNSWGQNWVSQPMYAKLWTQVVRSVQRPPMSTDFDVQVTREGNRGKIHVEALRKDSGFLNFLNLSGTVGRATDAGETQDVRLVQNGPGMYDGEFEVHKDGNYVMALNYRGQKKEDSGWLMAGLSVSESPEFRELESNDVLLEQIAKRTGGRTLDAWDVENAKLFTKDNLKVDWSPLPVRDFLLPLLVVLLLIDVAVRRIALDWMTMQAAGHHVAEWVRMWTLAKKVESGQTLDALKKVREGVAETRFGAQEKASGPPPALPSKSAKFEAKGVEGDISQVVGGASNKPLPSAPKEIKPKGTQPPAAGGHTGSLLEAKRRAQEQIRQKEQGE